MIKCIYTHDKKACDIENCKYEKCECREFYQQGREDLAEEVIKLLDFERKRLLECRVIDRNVDAAFNRIKRKLCAR